ncbi:MAG: hypothetical protein ACOZCL_00375 [Bacillota bacterium]
MDRVSFIQHKGKKILQIDFTDCHKDEVLKVIEMAKKTISHEPKNSVLTLTKVANTKYDTNTSEALKEYTNHNKPYVKAAAVIGLSGLQKVLYMTIVRFTGRNLQLFDDDTTAKDWLCTQ